MFRRAVLVLAAATVLATIGEDLQAASSGTGRVAYQSGPLRFCIMGVDGSSRSCFPTSVEGGQVEFIGDGQLNGQFAFSPDGSSVVFVRNGREGDGLYVMNVDGSHLRRLIAPLEGGEAGPAFSPDGRKIAFSSLPTSVVLKGHEGGLYVMNADGSHLTRLTPEGVPGRRPAFSPDGRKIAFVSGGLWTPPLISVINANGSEMRRLTEPPGAQCCYILIGGNPIFFGDDYPAFSPDGRKIVFNSRIRGTTLAFEGQRLYVMNADGSHLTPLTGPPGGDSHPVFSLDGLKVVFSSTRGNTDPSDGPQLYVMNADGSNLTRLTHPPERGSDPVFIR